MFFSFATNKNVQQHQLENLFKNQGIHKQKQSGHKQKPGSGKSPKPDKNQKPPQIINKPRISNGGGSLQLNRREFFKGGHISSSGRKNTPENQNVNKQRTNFKVDIIQNTFEDILFYEKKALQLEKGISTLNKNCLKIDTQMNLAEFLQKVQSSQIVDSDLKFDSIDYIHFDSNGLIFSDASEQRRSSESKKLSGSEAKNSVNSNALKAEPNSSKNSKRSYHIQPRDFSEASALIQPLQTSSNEVKETKINFIVVNSLLEETMKIMQKCKLYESELEKRDIVIQKAIMNMGENRTSSQGEVTKYVQNLLLAEVPRLILKEYDASRLHSQHLEEKLNHIEQQNIKLKSENFNLKETIKYNTSRYEMLQDEFTDLNQKHQSVKKGQFMVERMNDELINKELSEMRTLRDENQNIKYENSKFYQKNQSLKDKLSNKVKIMQKVGRKTLKQVQRYEYIINQKAQIKFKPLDLVISEHVNISNSIASFLGEDFLNVMILNKQLFSYFGVKTWYNYILKPKYTQMSQNIQKSLFKSMLSDNPLQDQNTNPLSNQVPFRAQILSEDSSYAHPECEICNKSLEKAERIAKFQEPEIYDEELQREVEEAIDYSNKVVKHYQQFLTPITLDAVKQVIKDKEKKLRSNKKGFMNFIDQYKHERVQSLHELPQPDTGLDGDQTEQLNPYLTDSQEKQREEFKQQEETTLETQVNSPEKITELDNQISFNSYSDVATFFKQIGQALRQPKIDQQINFGRLTSVQIGTIEQLKSERLQEYNLLNQDVNQCFHKLFFYINYLNAVNESQRPMFHYYRDNLKSLNKAYTFIKSQQDNMQATCIKQETQIRQLTDSVKLNDNRIHTQQTLIDALSKDLSDVQYDNIIVSNDRKQLSEQLKLVQQDFKNTQKELVTNIKEKNKHKQTVLKLKEFFDVVVKQNKSHCDLLK